MARALIVLSCIANDHHRSGPDGQATGLGGGVFNMQLPMTNSYSKQPNLQISMVWSNGAFNTNSGARKESGMYGYSDLS